MKNKDKILSLYDPDIHAVTRGEAHAEVDFGNTLFLAEQTEGLIVDWYLYQEQTAADHAMIPEHLQRMKNEHPIPVQAITGDRGLDSVHTAVLLGNTIGNYVCPPPARFLNGASKTTPSVVIHGVIPKPKHVLLL